MPPGYSSKAWCRTDRTSMTGVQRERRGAMKASGLEQRVRSKCKISPEENEGVKASRAPRTARLNHLRASVSPVCQHQSKRPKPRMRRTQRSWGVGVTPAPSKSEVDRVAALPAPIIRAVGWASSEVSSAVQFQMRGLESISVTRPNGRGPDNSFIFSMVSILIWIRVYSHRCTSYGQ